jgi:WYL_2, Sm-like SH3 beta-barrel fold
MGNYTRDTLLNDLRNNVVEVHFTKVNGEPRIMRCTLATRYLPDNYVQNLSEQESEKKFHEQNKDTLAVWDIHANGWRSFKIDSVTYVQALDVDYR